MKKLPELDDNELIALSNSGNAAATEKLIVRYKALVCKIARSYFIDSGGDTEDLIQEGTVGFLKAVRDYDGNRGVPFISFASACIANKVKDALRGLHREKHEPLNDAISISETDSTGELLLDELSVPEGSDPLSKYQNDERREDFYKTLGKIATPLQFSVLKLYLDGKSYKEIGEELGISAKLVDNTLVAVKLRIKKSKADFLGD